MACSSGWRPAWVGGGGSGLVVGDAPGGAAVAVCEEVRAAGSRRVVPTGCLGPVTPARDVLHLQQGWRMVVRQHRTWRQEPGCHVGMRARGGVVGRVAGGWWR